MGPSLLSAVPRSSFTTPSTLSTMGHSCVRRKQVLRENRSGPSPEQGTAAFSLNHLLCGPGVQDKSECTDGLGDTQVGGKGGWTLASEGRVHSAEGQLHRPPQKTSKDAGGMGEAHLRGQLGCGGPALP